MQYDELSIDNCCCCCVRGVSVVSIASVLMSFLLLDGWYWHDPKVLVFFTHRLKVKSVAGGVTEGIADNQPKHYVGSFYGYSMLLFCSLSTGKEMLCLDVCLKQNS